jgi:hypothetical protein
MNKTDPVENQPPKKQHEQHNHDSRGECDLCGEWAGRLVDGVCYGCRTQYRIK